MTVLGAPYMVKNFLAQYVRGVNDGRKKKKKSNKSPRLQPWDLSCGDGGPKIESNGNLRAPRPPAMILDPTDGCRAARAPAHTGLKKKGNVSHCAHATISSEKKLKTNGGKQNTYKFKK